MGEDLFLAESAELPSVLHRPVDIHGGDLDADDRAVLARADPENSARQAFVREMVGKEELRNAITLNSVTVNAARAVGPAIGGVLRSGGCSPPRGAGPGCGR